MFIYSSLGCWLKVCLFICVVLGEGDLIYTQTLCLIGQESYRGKKVLVLGGGDGGILHELLKEDPDFITVAEIGLLFTEFIINH